VCAQIQLITNGILFDFYEPPDPLRAALLHSDAIPDIAFLLRLGRGHSDSSPVNALFLLSHFFRSENCFSDRLRIAITNPLQMNPLLTAIQISRTGGEEWHSTKLTSKSQFVLCV
jgi:hypothetical protein